MKLTWRLNWDNTRIAMKTRPSGQSHILRAFAQPILRALAVFASALPLSLFAQPEAAGLTRLDGCVWKHSEGNDGDSFRITDPTGREWVLRLYFVDCPETSASDASSARRVREQTAYFGLPSHADTVEFGRAAESFSKRFLAEPFVVHTAYASAPGRSAGGRIYGFAGNKDGADLGEALVSAGLARGHGLRRSGPDGVHRDEIAERLRDLELAAALDRRGIWARSDPNRIVLLRAQIRAEQAVVSEIQKETSRLEDILSLPLDLNTASAEELEALPGIGPATSKAIIENRPFRSAEDLLRVRGISKARLDALRDYIKAGD